MDNLDIENAHMAGYSTGGATRAALVPGRNRLQTPRDPTFGDELARFVAAHNP